MSAPPGTLCWRALEYVETTHHGFPIAVPPGWPDIAPAELYEHDVRCRGLPHVIFTPVGVIVPPHDPQPCERCRKEERGRQLRRGPIPA